MVESKELVVRSGSSVSWTSAQLSDYLDELERKKQVRKDEDNDHH